MRYGPEIRRVLACMLALLGGCTTQSYAPTTDAGTLELKIKAGDEIRVVTTQRERLSFRVSEVRGDRFVGVTVEPRRKEQRPAGDAVEVPFDSLAMLEVTRFNSTTAGLATAAVVVSVSVFGAVLGAVPPALP